MNGSAAIRSHWPLRLLPVFLFDVRRPVLPYILKAWPLVLLPSLALATLAGLIAADAAQPDFGAPGLFQFFALVVFAPVVETLIMVPPLLLLNRLFGPAAAAVLSAAGWGVAHSLQAPIWGLVIWWPFLVFSTILLAWRKRSLAAGMAVVMCVHALQNAVPASLLLLAGTA